MNSGQVVRAEVDVSGAHLRIWIDNAAGKHVCVAELDVPSAQLKTWALEHERALEEERANEEAMFEI